MTPSAYAIPQDAVERVWQALDPRRRRRAAPIKHAIRVALGLMADEDGVEPQTVTGEQLAKRARSWSRSPEGKYRTKAPRATHTWFYDEGWKEDKEAWEAQEVFD